MFMDNLLNFLNSVHNISGDFRDRLEGTVQYSELGTKTNLLFERQICRNIYFVESGLLRGFYRKDGKEISTFFASEGELCSSFPSFFFQKYGREHIQAIEDSRVWYINHDQYRTFMTEYPEFGAICRTLLIKCQEAEQARLQAMWMQPAEARYKWLLNEWGDKFNRIPGKYICSYMGFTNVMLSRLRNGHIQTPSRFRSD
jgi:CRP-like cAMP-binding protein